MTLFNNTYTTHFTHYDALQMLKIIYKVQAHYTPITNTKNITCDLIWLYSVAGCSLIRVMCIWL